MSYGISLFSIDPNATYEQILEVMEARLYKLSLASTQERFVTDAQQAFAAELEKEYSMQRGGYSTRIELNSQTSGLQIGIYKDQVSLSVPYWYKANKATQIFKIVWSIMRRVQQKTGFHPVDMQVGKVLALNRPGDFKDVISVYLHTVGQVRTLRR